MSLIIKRALKAQECIDIPEEHILGWTVGFLEGDGYFGVTVNGHFNIIASQVHRPPLNTLHKLYGGSLAKTKLMPEKHNDIWRWVLQTKDAIKLAKQIYPFMSPKRKKQINKGLIATGGSPIERRKYA